MSTSRLFTVAIASTVLSLSAATAAQAQIGGLLKKAARNAIGAPAAAAAGSPTFDATVQELDQSRLAAVITGVKAQRAQTGPNGASAATLQQQAGVLFARRDSILAGRDGDLTRYHDATAANANCIRFFHDSLNAAHQAEMPKLVAKLGGYQGAGMQEIQALSIQMGQKLAAGDTAAVFRLRDQIWAKVGIDPKADSAKANAKCGSAPAKPAWIALADSTLARANQSLAAARDLEESSKAAGAQAAGMNAQQYAMALERIAAFVASKGKPALPWTFSGAERSALSARMAELQGLGIE